MGVPVSTVRSTLTLARRAAVLGDDAALLEHARAAQAGAERLGMMRVARQAAGLVAATTVDEAAR